MEWNGMEDGYTRDYNTVSNNICWKGCTFDKWLKEQSGYHKQQHFNIDESASMIYLQSK